MTRSLVKIRESDLEELMERADKSGVELEVSFDVDGMIYLGRIQRGSGCPGAGRRVLDMLCELADDAGLAVCLAVIRWLDPVIALYEDLGFSQIPNTNIFLDDDFQMMERPPS